MNISRTQLINTLKKVAPALSDKDMVPVFSCFCFTGKKVYAFDDTVMLATKLDIGLKGGVRGKALLAWLGATKRKDVSIDLYEDGVVFKAANAKFTQPYTPEEDFLFDTKELKRKGVPMDPTEFFTAVERCSLSIGTDASKTHMTGITVEIMDGHATFFSTDNSSASMYELACDEADTRTILPPRFCSLFLSRRVAPTEVVLHADFVRCKYPDGTVLYGRTLLGEDASTDEYRSVFEGIGNPKFVAIPKSLNAALDRARVPLEGTTGLASTFSVAGKRLTINTETPMGDARDVLPFKHSDVEVEAPPEIIQRALGHVSTMAIVEGRCLALQAEDGYTYLVAVVNTVADAEEAYEDDIDDEDME